MASQLVKQAEHDAEEVIATVWADADGTVRLPVDPVAIARAYDLQTYEVELDPNVSGAIVNNGTDAPFILINTDDSQNRMRFSCAHELGHYIRRLNNLNASETFEYVDYRGPLATEGTDPDEVYANNFAAALLMPAREVRSLRKAGESPSSLAYIFQVSAEAMELRFANLGLQ